MKKTTNGLTWLGTCIKSAVAKQPEVPLVWTATWLIWKTQLGKTCRKVQICVPCSSIPHDWFNNCCFVQPQMWKISNSIFRNRSKRFALSSGLQPGTLKSDKKFQPRSLYLPDIHVNSSVYCNSRLLDVQGLVFRKPLPSLFIKASTNPSSKLLQKLGTSKGRSSSFFLLHDKQQVLDLPDITARVYNQVANEINNDFANNSVENFTLKGEKWHARWNFRLKTHHTTIIFFSRRLCNWRCGWDWENYFSWSANWWFQATSPMPLGKNSTSTSNLRTARAELEITSVPLDMT